ncbi:MAG: hypothetical protein ACTSVY_10220 [Candidatus Helarchaeota archaeon]
MTLTEELSELKKKITLREWLLEQLKECEAKYGLTTESFIKKWKAGKLPEPEENDVLEDFLEWEGLSESLEQLESELRVFEKHTREN